MNKKAILTAAALLGIAMFAFIPMVQVEAHQIGQGNDPYNIVPSTGNGCAGGPPPSSDPPAAHTCTVGNNNGISITYAMCGADSATHCDLGQVSSVKDFHGALYCRSTCP